MAARRPNILLIVSDQECHRADLPSELGLPAHERLLERGVEFDGFHVTTTPCTPSRAVIYTGQHTKATGVIANTDAPPFRVLPAGIPTVGTMLREQGYYTAYKGKWHLGGADLPAAALPVLPPSTRDALEPHGFADFTDDGDHWGRSWDGFRYDRAIAADAALWLNERGRALSRSRQPWLLAVNFVNPHDIMFFDATGTMASRRLHPRLISELRTAPPVPPYDREWDVPLPRSFDDDLSRKPWAHANFGRWNGYFFGGIDHGDRDAWRRYRSYYFNCIRDLDAALATVLDALAASGMDDDTVIVYTSDHGELAGAHGLAQKGPVMYRENVRVPFIVVHPRVRGGGSTRALGSALDLAPTLLAFSGLAPQARAERYPALTGVDLTPALQGERTERDRRGILFYYGVLMLSFDADRARAMVKARLEGAAPPPDAASRPTQPLDDPALFRGLNTGRWKFARYFRPDRHHVPGDWDTLLAHNGLELYDLAADPDELANLAAEPAARRGLILDLNARLNAAIAAEIGADDGSEFPGDPAWYRLA